MTWCNFYYDKFIGTHGDLLRGNIVNLKNSKSIELEKFFLCSKEGLNMFIGKN